MKNKAFTLVEFLVVVAVAAILVAMIAGVFGKLPSEKFTGPVLEKKHYAAYTSSRANFLATVIVPVHVAVHVPVHHPERWTIIMAGTNAAGNWRIFERDLTKDVWDGVKLGQSWTLEE